ncbi:hypothetical protein CWS02_00270 [Enterobacter sp. EA-1]|nr:hypothetical protein CWS02_00270 [Enterobacter sp. EA-1]
METEKQTIAALSTLASGLAGGLIGESTETATAAASAGKTTVENNYLSDKDITTFVKKYAEAKTEEEREKLLVDLKKLDVDQQQQALATGISIGDQKAVLEKLKILVASPAVTISANNWLLTQYRNLSPLQMIKNYLETNKLKSVLQVAILALTLG